MALLWVCFVFKVLQYSVLCVKVCSSLADPSPQTLPHCASASCSVAWLWPWQRPLLLSHLQLLLLFPCHLSLLSQAMPRMSFTCAIQEIINHAQASCRVIPKMSSESRYKTEQNKKPKI